VCWREQESRRSGSTTFATIALQNGVDIKTVSGMPGHFSAGFTLDTYAHVTTSAQKEAAQTMANVLSM
jgi:site-specific recombinase XerD